MALADFLKNKFFFSGGGYLPSGGRITESPTYLPYNPDRLKNNPTANRCINMIIDAAASIEYEISDGEKLEANSQLQPKAILSLINRKANKFMDSNFFWRTIITDLLYYGNSFILVDNKDFYHIPAEGVSVEGDGNRLVTFYKYGDETFKAEKVIHIKENSLGSAKLGESRFKSLTDIVDLHKKMKDFQKNFFVNNAMPGIVLQSPNTLTRKLKERKLEEWKQDFNPTSGARKPAFLDGGISVENLNTSTFREMDFETSIQSIEKDIAKSVGVPPILLNGGNDANITPNHRLFYLETVMPICEKIAAALSLYFGYKINTVRVGVPALQPDLRDLGNYVTSITNGGIISPTEARMELGFPEEVNGEIRVPANIAGSASDPSQGGRPKEPDTGE